MARSLARDTGRCLASYQDEDVVEHRLALVEIYDDAERALAEVFASCGVAFGIAQRTDLLHLIAEMDWNRRRAERSLSPHRVLQFYAERDAAWAEADAAL
jgi:hypothetical protein